MIVVKRVVSTKTVNAIWTSASLSKKTTVANSMQGGEVGMKGNEVTAEDTEKWKKDGMIPATCRLCGEVVLHPSKFFKKDELTNYECANCKMYLRLLGRR